MALAIGIYGLFFYTPGYDLKPGERLVLAAVPVELRPIPVRHVRISATIDDVNEEIALDFGFKGDPARVVTLALYIDGKGIALPEDDLQDIEAPILDQIQMSYTPGRSRDESDIDIGIPFERWEKRFDSDSPEFVRYIALLHIEGNKVRRAVIACD